MTKTQPPELSEMLEELNKFYGSMFEAGDFDSLYALITKAYGAGQDSQNRKANSGRLLYQDGFKSGEMAERERTVKIIEQYFAGLVVIADPQATLVSILNSLQQEEKNI